MDVEEIGPDSAEGRLVLRAYFSDIVSRFHQREATQAEVTAAIEDEPSDDLCPPHGLFLVARIDGAVIGCAGLRLIRPETGELTRFFVLPQARNQGVGQRLLDEIEARARRQGLVTLRLDTGSHLTEALRVYVRAGYREVSPFSNGSHCDRWYEKSLAG